MPFVYVPSFYMTATDTYEGLRRYVASLERAVVQWRRRARPIRLALVEREEND